jgi:general secretion pathway protein C
MSETTEKRLPIPVVITVLLALVSAKLFWVVIEILYLPSEGIDYEGGGKSASLYYRYRLANESGPVVKKRVVSQPAGRIRDFTLKGLYEDGDNSIAILTKGNKSHLLSIGESVNGYRLEKVESKSAWFEKGGKSYRLKLKEKNSGRIDRSYRVIRSSAGETSRKGDSGKVADSVVDGAPKVVSRGILKKYSQNADNIWKNITIDGVKRNGHLYGFEVKYVKRDSVFDKLGLERGDIIIAINGEEITDYGVPMRLMSEIDTIENLTLTVKRGKMEKELEYEIR